jgi:hypothetical protein
VRTKRPRTPSKRLQGKSKPDPDQLGRKQARPITGRKPAKGRLSPAKPERIPLDERSKQSGRRSTAKLATSKRASRGQSNRDYAIGKGKPPPEYTWRPGQSGNSRGRPKGRKNEATIWKEILGRRITIPIGGKLTKVTILEAIQYRIANDALTGNIKSAGFILNRFAVTVTGDEPATDSSEADRAVLEAFVRRLKDETSES